MTSEFDQSIEKAGKKKLNKSCFFTDAYSNAVFKCKPKRQQQSMNSFHTVNSMIFCIISVSCVKFAWQSTSRYACHPLWYP